MESNTLCVVYVVCILFAITSGNTFHDVDIQQHITKGSSSLSSSSIASAITEAISISTTSSTISAALVAASSLSPSAEQRALSWLLLQRDPRDFGFSNDTALVLITIQIARSIGLAPAMHAPLLEPIDVALSGKQLEVETVVALWRHSTVQPPPHRLALACLALSALCRDPRQFHGHDLIGTLLHHHDSELQVQGKDKDRDGGDQQHQLHQLLNLSDLEFGYATLAACAARAHVRKREVRRLLDIANSPQRHNIDTLAVTIMTLRCIIVHDHRHRNWLHSIRKPSVSLARQQLADGSFGNIYNTALAMQALASTHSLNSSAAHSNGYWRAAAARRWLELHQDLDGAFTDPGLTAMAILALMNKGMDAVRTLADSAAGVCSADHGQVVGLTLNLQGDETDVDVDGAPEQQNNNNNSYQSSADKDGASSADSNSSHVPYFNSNLGSNNANVTVSYTLWIGGSSSNISAQQVIASASICAGRNATFYTVMVLAAERDPTHFTFEASQWPNGHYVHTIAGHREEPMGYHYWLLYRLDSRPDPAHPPGSHQVAPVGVDDLIIEEGDHFLYWYKKL